MPNADPSRSIKYMRSNSTIVYEDQQVRDVASAKLHDIVIIAQDPDRTKVNVQIAGRVLQYRKRKSRSY
jgi:hypothetical protein